MWQVATTRDFDRWFAELAADGQAEVMAKVELLKLLGPQLGRPHADTLKGARHANLKELRADKKHLVLRIAFAFDPERVAILLVAGDKSGISSKRFYKQLIARADELLAAHLAKIKARQQKESKENGKNFR
jgi:hypothetical protein